jgi:hypothetical protein
VDPAPGQGIEVGRQGRHQRLALAGAHLGDLALVEHDAADQLDVEVAQAEGAGGRLAHHREGLREQLLEAGAGGQARAQLRGLGGQRGSVERRDGFAQLIDGAHRLAQRTQGALVVGAEQFSE